MLLTAPLSARPHQEPLRNLSNGRCYSGTGERRNMGSAQKSDGRNLQAEAYHIGTSQCFARCDHDIQAGSKGRKSTETTGYLPGDSGHIGGMRAAKSQLRGFGCRLAWAKGRALSLGAGIATASSRKWQVVAFWICR